LAIKGAAFWTGKKNAFKVDRELVVDLFFGDTLQRGDRPNPCISEQDVQFAKTLFDSIDEVVEVVRLAQVRLEYDHVLAQRIACFFNAFNIDAGNHYFGSFAAQ
jgi:hypothetical protein